MGIIFDGIKKIFFAAVGGVVSLAAAKPYKTKLSRGFGKLSLLPFFLGPLDNAKKAYFSVGQTNLD